MKREQIDKAHAKDLYAAILQLQTLEEVESFFFDLCTPAELEEIVDRWRVAQMLVRKMPYRQIAADDGYRTIMRRLGKIED